MIDISTTRYSGRVAEKYKPGNFAPPYADEISGLPLLPSTLETRKFLKKYQRDFARWAIALFCNNQLRKV